MYYIRDIAVKYGERTLLDNVSFMVSPKERIGLIGRNGAGKSTLLKIIAGQTVPDGGSLEFPSKTTVGYLRQEFELNETLSVINETMSCHKEALEIQQKLNEVNHEIAQRHDYESPAYHQLLVQLAELSGQLEHFNIAALEVETVKVLRGLGFTESDLQKKVAELSGGWKMRIELAKLLIRKPDILLLDEPTNHLDIESIIWLEQYLQDYLGTVIVISHDTQFLDNVSNRTIEVEGGKITDLKLKYSIFIREKEKQKTILQAAFENQQRDIAQKEKTINRFMAKASKTKMAQSMQKQLEKIDRIEVPAESAKAMQIRFAEVPRSGRDVIRTINISKSFGEKVVFRNVNITIERGDRVSFVGQNGQGKTTMAKIIAGLIQPTSGQLEIGSNMHLSYYAQNQSELLDLKSTVMQVMEDKAPEEMRPKVRSIMGSFLFSGEDADKKISVLSGGERARLAMASLIMKPCNFLILDEPTNHLDIYSKDILKEALMHYKGTLLVISHDRSFLSGLTNKIIEFKDGQTFEYLGDIEYFLNKKQLGNMREVELQKDSTSTSTLSDGSKVQIMSSQDQWKMKKMIQSIEREIEKIESEISTIEIQLANPEIYTDPKLPEINKKYAVLKLKLSDKMEEWEAMSLQIAE